MSVRTIPLPPCPPASHQAHPHPASHSTLPPYPRQKCLPRAAPQPLQFPRVERGAALVPTRRVARRLDPVHVCVCACVCVRARKVRQRTSFLHTPTNFLQPRPLFSPYPHLSPTPLSYPTPHLFSPKPPAAWGRRWGVDAASTRRGESPRS